MASTLKEISQAAGTSVSTASLILNGRQAHRFTEATQKAVIDAANQLGYQPQRAAQALVTGKTGNIAVLVNSLTNPFFARYLSLLQQLLVNDGYTTVPIEISPQATAEKGQWMDWIDRRAVDAVIDLQGVMRVGEEMASVYMKFGENRPIVFRQLLDDPMLGAHAGVVVDYAAGFAEMAEHLADIGCKEIGMVTVEGHTPRPTKPGGKQGGDHQFIGMVRGALDEAGLNCPASHFRGVKNESAEANDWCAITLDLLRAKPKLQALVVHNMDAVPAVLHGIKLAGRSLGDDLSLTSFDDTPQSRWIGPGITVVREPAKEVAAAMAELVLNEVAGKRRSGHKRTLKTRLIVRGSTDPSWSPYRPSP
ncbi:MAG: LacI family DNA-binding transcriptional regulator [Planctomycetota bacterium]